MKTKILQIIISSLTLLSLNSVAQESSSGILKKFSPGVISKVYEVSALVPLSPESELKFAQYFAREEKLIAAALSKGAGPQELSRLKATQRKDFLQLFDSRQLSEYLVKQKSNAIARVTDSILLKRGLLKTGTSYEYAYVNRKKLALQQSQIDTLIHRLVNLKRTEAQYKAAYPKEEFSTYCIQDFRKILSAEQYKNFMFLKGRSTAKKWAQETYAELKKYDLDKEVDSAAVVKKLYNYQLYRYAYVRVIEDKDEKNAMIRNLLRNRPEILKQLSNLKAGKSKTGATVMNSFAW